MYWMIGHHSIFEIILFSLHDDDDDDDICETLMWVQVDTFESSISVGVEKNFLSFQCLR